MSQNRSLKVTVSINTNPQVQGRYTVEVRDVTGDRNRQMNVKITDAPADFLDKLTEACDKLPFHFIIEVQDETGE
jgi:hypothetical protein